jgi:hypothetical protein
MKRALGILLGILVLLSWMISAFQLCTAELNYQADSLAVKDYEEFDTLQTVHKHQRSWLDYYNNQNYALKYAIASAQESEAFRERDEFIVDYWQTEEEFWQKVYFDMYEKNKTRLTFLEDSLQSIRDSLQLEREDFARMVVSFVQDIPYQYILPEGCEGHNDFPCVPNVKYGILSPIEFLNTLQGDCDTRTVLLFTLLRNFGYEPVILNSNEYLHSMLALDISTSGEYLEYKGKRYAFWETTNVGWLPGMLPPDMSNKNYWSVILDL